MMPPSLFRSRSFVAANLLTFFLYAAFGGALFYLPLNLIQVQHYSPTMAGVALLPLILLLFVLSRWAGGMATKHGPRRPLTIGPLLAGVGFALLARPGVGGSYWTNYFPGLVALGLGMAISVAPLTTLVMNSVELDRAGSASGVNNAISQVASLLALAVFGLTFFHVFERRLESNLESAHLPAAVVEQIEDQRAKLGGIETNDGGGRAAVDEAFVSGFRMVLWMAAGLGVAASLSVGVILRGEGHAHA